jgi:hypothetical protein
MPDHIAPTDIEPAYPVLVQLVDGALGSPAQAGAPVDGTVRNALSNALGWRWREGDAAGFFAALSASFELYEVEGHIEYRHTPRGFAVMADLGAVTGGQAVVAARAHTTIQESQGLLTSLHPLRPEADLEKSEALRSQVGHALTELRNELEQPVIRQERVDAIFSILTGAAKAPANPSAVQGQLSKLREEFGLEADNVNDVDEERVVTSFATLVDWVLSLQLAWDQLKGQDAEFLGTALIQLSAEMATVVEQVDQLETAFDSVRFTDAQRQTVEVDKDTGLTIDGLLRWLRDFNAVEGHTILTGGGRIGLETAFVPTLEQLYHEFLELHQLRDPAIFHRQRIIDTLEETRQALDQVRKSAKSVARDGKPFIRSISPTRAKVGREQTFTIEGAGFDLGNITVKIAGADTKQPPVVSVDSATLVKVKARLTKVGWAEVKVTVPTGDDIDHVLVEPWDDGIPDATGSVHGRRSGTGQHRAPEQHREPREASGYWVLAKDVASVVSRK